MQKRYPAGNRARYNLHLLSHSPSVKSQASPRSQHRKATTSPLLTCLPASVASEWVSSSMAGNASSLPNGIHGHRRPMQPISGMTMRSMATSRRSMNMRSPTMMFCLQVSLASHSRLPASRRRMPSVVPMASNAPPKAPCSSTLRESLLPNVPKPSCLKTSRICYPMTREHFPDHHGDPA